MFDGNWDDIRWRQGKSDKKYSYTLRDIAMLRGVSVGHIRNLVSLGKLDPTSLKEVVLYVKGGGVINPMTPTRTKEIAP